MHSDLRYIPNEHFLDDYEDHPIPHKVIKTYGMKRYTFKFDGNY